MRIAIGQLMQETNTLNPLVTTRRNFDQFGVMRGQEILDKLHDTNEIGGFIQSLRAWPRPPEIIGLARLFAWPTGLAEPDVTDWIRDEFVAPLRRALPVDGVLLALHGAMAGSACPDVEGMLLAACREVIGPKIPLVATLDLHANITQEMLRQADALVLFLTAPHIDVFETGVRGAGVLRKILLEGAKPAMAAVKIPLVVPAERANTEDPASVAFDFKRELVQLEATPGVLAAGLAPVQPWLDVPELGTTVVVVTDNDPAKAEREAKRLAAEVWCRREDYLPELTDLAEAVRRAHDQAQGLTVLSDSADATTSGATGDSTWVLRELLRYDWPRPALVTMVSPEVVELARERGEGAEIETDIGGVRDARFSRPVAIRARVTRLFDARFVLSGHLAKNLPVDMGPSAVLTVGNIQIVVTSRSGPHFAPQLFQAAGLDPFAAQVLVAKSPCGFRAAYAPRASQIMVVKAPGCAPPDFWNYEYKHILRPAWPWDRDLEWQPEA